MRDAVLAVSGKLNREMYGPGYRDFELHRSLRPDLRLHHARTPRSCGGGAIYRFVVRTTPHQFLTTLDCPNPANLTPARSTTTTALQSLALLNNEFMLKQAGHLCRAGRRPKPEIKSTTQVSRAFALAFGRSPTPGEEARRGRCRANAWAGVMLCRVLLNANEFVYVD